MKPRIRQATALDAPAIAAMKAQAWQESYAGLVPDDVLARVGSAEAVARTADVMAHQMFDEGAFFWAVTDADADGEIVGAANAMPSRDDDRPTPLELTMIYLLERAKGTGVAGPLLRTTIGDADCSLWVLDGNERAISFLRRHGFEPDGTSQRLDGLGGVEEIRLVRRGDDD